METHVLNGDALKEKFPFPTHIIVCRECLIDGPVHAVDDDAFWKMRENFINLLSPPDAQYQELVVNEFKRLKAETGGVINLWFEHDLFCQINLWFTIDYISRHLPGSRIFIASPAPDPDWRGFGALNYDDLIKVYRGKLELTEADRNLAIKLWAAYRTSDRQQLSILSEIPSYCFPKLKEVCEAEIARHPTGKLPRPQKRLKSIVDSGINSFDEIFATFQLTEAIYGFGDLQVKQMLRELTM